jgi:hypothetical protein
MPEQLPRRTDPGAGWAGMRPLSRRPVRLGRDLPCVPGGADPERCTRWLPVDQLGCAPDQYADPSTCHCLSCPTGQTPDDSRTGCRRICPTGQVPGPDGVSCVSCPAGQIESGGSCTPCPEGRRPNSTGDRCECPGPAELGCGPRKIVIQYLPEGMSCQCTACNSDKIAGQDGRQCASCPLGTVPDQLTGQCVPLSRRAHSGWRRRLPRLRPRRDHLVGWDAMQALPGRPGLQRGHDPLQSLP